MGAAGVDQAISAGPILVEDQELAEQPHPLCRLLLELGDGGDRLPVASQQLAHRRAGPDLR